MMILHAQFIGGVFVCVLITFSQLTATKRSQSVVGFSDLQLR